MLPGSDSQYKVFISIEYITKHLPLSEYQFGSTCNIYMCQGMKGLKGY